MTEHPTDPMDAYGLRLGRELHALSDRVLQPVDAAAIAHEVAIGHRRAARPFAVGGATLRAPGRLLLVIVALATAILLALWLVVGQQPSSPLAFAPGSIAYTRDGSLSVAAPDGRDPVVFARPDPSRGESIGAFGPAFAFSPDGRRLAYIVETKDPVDPNVGGDLTPTLTIVTPGDRPEETVPGCCYGFGWAPDGQRLAVDSGALHQHSIVGLDGQHQVALQLPAGFDHDHSLSEAHAMPWSPDGRWIAVRGCQGMGIACKGWQDWAIVASDGSGAHWLHGDPSRLAPEEYGEYLAWGPDSRLAVTSRSNGSLQIMSAAGELLEELALPAGWAPAGPPSWSTDGTELVVLAGRLEDGQVVTGTGIAVLGIDGTSSVIPGFTIDSATPASVRWSVDGTHVVWLDRTDATATPTTALWSSSLSGATAERLIDANVDAFDVAPGAAR